MGRNDNGARQNGAHQNGAQQNSIQDFLTPEAMLTPGVAGSMTMMITNALSTNFNMPRAWMGLALSFTFGLLVLVSTGGLLKKALFYVLNSLVIFCVAVGANGLGTAGPPVARAALTLITPAQAQSTTSQQDVEHCANIAATIEAAQRRGATGDQLAALVRPCQTVSQDILKNQATSNAPAVQAPGKFFSPWKF